MQKVTIQSRTATFHFISQNSSDVITLTNNNHIM